MKKCHTYDFCESQAIRGFTGVREGTLEASGNVYINDRGDMKTFSDMNPFAESFCGVAISPNARNRRLNAFGRRARTVFDAHSMRTKKPGILPGFAGIYDFKIGNSSSKRLTTRQTVCLPIVPNRF
jgi:hypothetical protein